MTGLEPVLVLEVGAIVSAFHPRTLGVVRPATVLAVGRYWLRLDFGELGGGAFRVAPRDVLELLELPAAESSSSD